MPHIHQVLVEMLLSDNWPQHSQQEDPFLLVREMLSVVTDLSSYEFNQARDCSFVSISRPKCDCQPPSLLDFKENVLLQEESENLWNVHLKFFKKNWKLCHQAGTFGKGKLYIKQN